MRNINLDFERQKDNFIDCHNSNALFNTKFADGMDHNGEIVKVFGLLKGKNSSCDRYIVLFNDGTMRNDIYDTELNFNHIKENSKNKKIKEER